MNLEAVLVSLNFKVPIMVEIQFFLAVLKFISVLLERSIDVSLGLFDLFTLLGSVKQVAIFFGSNCRIGILNVEVLLLTIMCLFYRGYVGIYSSGFRDFLLKPELLRAIVDSGFEHPSEGKYTVTCVV